MVGAATILAVLVVEFCAQRGIAFAGLQRIELMTYDARVRWTARLAQDPFDRLAGVFIDDDSLRKLNDGYVGGERYSWPWPRQVYGRILRELAAQGAIAVGFDVFFDELRPSDAAWVEDGTSSGSDEFLARQLRQTGIGILAAESIGAVLPADLFRTNAPAVGSIYAHRDADNVVRKAKPCFSYREWHPDVTHLARALELDLERVVAVAGGLRIASRKAGEEPFLLELDPGGYLRPDNLSPGWQGPQRPFVERRLWHLGLQLGARVLGLDLETAEVHPRRIVLKSASGLTRTLPLDEAGFLLIDWQVRVGDPRITVDRQAPAWQLLSLDRQRQLTEGGRGSTAFRNMAVVVGSIGTGNNVSDSGATPLEDNAMLVATHWNVAGALINDRFIQRTPGWLDLLLVVLFGGVSAWATWTLRVGRGLVLIGGTALVYVVVAVLAFLTLRWWMPIIAPIVGGLILPQMTMATCRVVFEQREHRRVKAVFSKVVAPDVVVELLQQERLALGGARRRMTVLFSDVRGFTELTDASQQRAELEVRQAGLTGGSADSVFDRSASDTLETVNLYLGTVADVIKQHRGVLDKYIGDCVMAFWGAPMPNPNHAVECVRAAIDIQRSIARLNELRRAENERREAGKAARSSRGESPLPPLPLLTLGTGINTGQMIVGLMGSEAHISNYTVFGREVNLASRLEGLSGHGRILVGEATYQDLVRLDPTLAARCRELPGATVKGIRGPVRAYEVVWREVDPGGGPPAVVPVA